MRIAFFTLGSRGDIEPMIALAKGFADAGHEVLIVSDESAERLVQPHGIPGHFLRGSLRERFSSSSGRQFWRARDPYRVGRDLTALFADLISGWMVEAAEVMQGCRLVITSKATFGIGYALAEKIRAVGCETSMTPHAPTRYLPAPLLPWQSAPIPGSFTRLLHEASSRAVWLGVRETVNAARRALGLQEVAWPFGQGRPALLDAIPQLYGFSPTLVPRPPDWPKNITITGFWHHRDTGSWRPPSTLAAFLDAGPRPIYVGFGSAVDSRPSQLQDIVVNTVRGLGLRAIISTGWDGMAGLKNADDLFIVDDVPHDWLFPRVAAVVCHGGAGTVGTIARSGTPSVIVPYGADHPFWGWALERAGLAPRMIPRRRLSVERLTDALRRATTDEVMHQRTQDVAKRVRAEDGVRRAVEVVEAWLSPSLPAGRALGSAARS